MASTCHFSLKHMDKSARTERDQFGPNHVIYNDDDEWETGLNVTRDVGKVVNPPSLHFSRNKALARRASFLPQGKSQVDDSQHQLKPRRY